MPCLAGPCRAKPGLATQSFYSTVSIHRPRQARGIGDRNASRSKPSCPESSRGLPGRVQWPSWLATLLSLRCCLLNFFETDLCEWLTARCPCRFPAGPGQAGQASGPRPARDDTADRFRAVLGRRGRLLSRPPRSRELRVVVGRELWLVYFSHGSIVPLPPINL